jgi:hypothetical protein
MATVNFQCGHCHNLMAVGEEFLGQQVRCPHCQQVVLAPAPAPPSPAELPSIEVPSADEDDSIFTPPEAANEDLFGEPPAPRVELPPDSAVPRLALDDATLPTEPAPPGAPEPGVAMIEPTATYAEPEPAPGDALPRTDGVPGDAGASTVPQETAAPPAEGGLPLLTIEPKHRVARGNPWVIPLVIAPLAFYSFMATLYILDTKFFHLATPPPPPHPLEILPDTEGDNKGAAGRGAKHSSTRTWWPDPDQPLAPAMCVGLGQTLAVGDLEVRPEKVERRRLGWEIDQAFDPFPSDVLSLTLRLRNRSQDVTFKPMDRYFARARSSDPNRPQYTLLEMGGRRFFGGPLDWKRRNEFVKGQAVNKELKPGDEMTTFVCTNPDDHAVKALDAYDGPLLWHVQLRRGLVRWTTKDGVDREDPATTVVGVEFTSADVKKPGS